MLYNCHLSSDIRFLISPSRFCWFQIFTVLSTLTEYISVPDIPLGGLYGVAGSANILTGLHAGIKQALCNRHCYNNSFKARTLQAAARCVIAFSDYVFGVSSVKKQHTARFPELTLQPPYLRTH